MSETESIGALCRQWWGRTIAADGGAARAARARLRRCEGVAGALTLDAVHDLHAQLRNAGYHPNPERLALITVTLAHVTHPGRRRLPAAFGRRPSPGAPPALSRQRFLSLIHATRHDELLAPLRRAMGTVRHERIAVASTALDLYHWSESTRTQWCLKYFNA